MTSTNISVECSVNRAVCNKVSRESMGILQRNFKTELLTADAFCEAVQQGFAVNPAVLAVDESGNSIRTVDAFQRAQLVMLDIDNCITLPDGIKRKKTDEQGYIELESFLSRPLVQSAVWAVYTSFSHTPEHHRFRIVFCLPKPISDAVEYAQVVEAFIDWAGADPQCSSAVHCYYGNTNTTCYAIGGVLTDEQVEHVRSRYHKIPAEEKHVEANVNGNLTTEHVRDMLRVIPPQMHYIDWVRCISAIRAKFDEETTRQLVEEWSPGSPGEVAYKIRHRMSRIGFGTLVWMAKEHGWRPPRDFYKTGSIDAQKYNLTESGNADRLVQRYRGEIYYVHDTGKTFIWDGKRYAEDKQGRHLILVRKRLKEIYAEAKECANSADMKLCEKWAEKSEAKRTIENSWALAVNGTDLAATSDMFDANPYLVNLRNGVFDLKEFALYDHHPGNHNTKLINIDYDENAECPFWRELLETWFDGDAEMISFIQRAIGYSLSGLLSEQCLFFLYGTGKNGKSIFTNTMATIFGDYFQKAPSELLIMKREQSSNSNDVARLKGARFVSSQELPENKRFDESKLKDLTGDDKLVARYLRQEFFEFDPTHKLWIYGNHKPLITGTDLGIWRRIKLIPFTVTIPDEKRLPANEIKEKLESELKGILRWAIEGFYLWANDGGLREPNSVVAAGEAYRHDMDVLGTFIEQNVVMVPGANPNSKEGNIEFSKVYERYKDWAEKNGEFPIKSKQLMNKMRERGYSISMNERRISMLYQASLVDVSTQELAFLAENGTTENPF